MEEGHLYSSETVGRAEGVAGVCLILLAIALFTLVRCIRMSRGKRDHAIRTNVADSSDPNVVRQNLFMHNMDKGHVKLCICAENVHLYQTYYTQYIKKHLHYQSKIWGQ